MLVPHTINKQTKPRLPKEFGDILFADQQIALVFIIRLIGNSKHLKHLLNISSVDSYEPIEPLPSWVQVCPLSCNGWVRKHRSKDIMWLFEDFKPVNGRSEIQIQTLLPTSV